ncbi:hypothetical protein DS909_16505 [Phaeobacter gallaeciensis]|uniref:Uncharacterized protein n=2 Tax=Roseobacteraceae TaxID=2854170 RepID=A0A366WS39_9RHOB|nr:MULTISPECIES: hypothetical protein [Roseobacteraceae]MBT3140888.1 hypothetical protein [Falsiruegeria litorea]MBT8170632.1 hypothetical protein [Falsiruegeria litorea]RBW52835.1 hypothetical protein DS909_16505 [Phaeobacter gallaeciensis]
MSTTAGLWLAVVLSGLYHGLNPGMGWPLAVSSALMEQRPGALYRALGALAIGHFLAMLVILLPLSTMTLLIHYERQLRLVAGVIVVGLGLWLLITRKHPRFLSRIPPTRLALWSFLVALVHGAALMLVPIYLGLCRIEELDQGHRAAADLMARNAMLTLGVAVLHTAAMLLAGGGLAIAVHRWLGLQFLSRSWFDLEAIWALSLILVGGLGIYSALPA